MARIMVVEDEESLRLLYQRRLEKQGHSVVGVASGEECLRRIDRDRPDLIVLDIRMPGMSGIEALGHIRVNHGSLPVVLNTAFDCYRDNFLTWTADAYVVKSSDTTPLESAIRKLLPTSTQSGTSSSSHIEAGPGRAAGPSPSAPAPHG
jgi:DNA-binding response OmpR family regulator